MVAPVNAADLEVLFAPNRKPMFVGKPVSWWHKNGKLMAQQSAFLADTDCRQLVGTVLELQRDNYWQKFSDDWGQFCRDTFGRPAEWVEQVVEGVRLLHLQKPEALNSPVTADEAIELKSHGGDRRSEEARRDQVDNINLKGGTQAAYLKARLRRDHPEIAEELEQGKHRSARAAAIEAGIIRPVPTVRLVDDPEKVAAAIRKHWSSDRIAALLQALSSSPPQP